MDTFALLHDNLVSIAASGRNASRVVVIEKGVKSSAVDIDIGAVEDPQRDGFEACVLDRGAFGEEWVVPAILGCEGGQRIRVVLHVARRTKSVVFET
jgi:hypothetical protein